MLSIRIVLSRFHLLIFYFEKFLTWIWRLSFEMKLKLSLDITLQYVIYIFGVIHASSKIDEIRTLRYLW